jgi:hypothetical protein
MTPQRQQPNCTSRHRKSNGILVYQLVTASNSRPVNIKKQSEIDNPFNEMPHVSLIGTSILFHAAKNKKRSVLTRGTLDEQIVRRQNLIHPIYLP